MDYPFIERRRAPRASTETAALSAVHVSVPVRLLDLGSDGLLMASWAPLRVGSTVRVAAAFAGRRLDVELSVRHVSGQWDERVGGYVVGGSFASFDAAARQLIAALLSRERTQRRRRTQRRYRTGSAGCSQPTGGPGSSRRPARASCPPAA